MLASADSSSFTIEALGTDVATTLGALANATFVEPRSIAATASSSCRPSFAASTPNAFSSLAFLGFRISKAGCEMLFLTSFLCFLGFEAVSRTDVLQPKISKFDFLLESSARVGAGLGDVVIVGDGVDLSSGSTYSMWRLISAESASTGRVGVSGGRGFELMLPEALVRGCGSMLVGEIVEMGGLADL